MRRAVSKMPSGSMTLVSGKTANGRRWTMTGVSAMAGCLRHDVGRTAKWRRTRLENSNHSVFVGLGLALRRQMEVRRPGTTPPDVDREAVRSGRTTGAVLAESGPN